MLDLKKKLVNRSQANKFFSKIINNYKEGDDVLNEYIIELITYHPTKILNISNMKWLKMKKRPPYNTLALFYKDKKTFNIDDISWKLCIQNLFGKYDKSKEKLKDINSAFRNESHIGSKKNYHINNTIKINENFGGICKNCNIKTTNITTDHYPIPYKKIFEDFLNENDIQTLNDIEIFENSELVIRLKNTELASNWLEFHDCKATYRLLCRSCNSHFGSYGY